MYKTGEFAKLIGVTVQTLQNWDRSGKLKAGRTVTGQRVYSEKQLEDVLKGMKGGE